MRRIAAWIDDIRCMPFVLELFQPASGVGVVVAVHCDGPIGGALGYLCGIPEHQSRPTGEGFNPDVARTLLKRSCRIRSKRTAWSLDEE